MHLSHSQTNSGPELTLKQFLENVVELIPSAGRYPEIACARIIIARNTVSTSNLADTKWIQKAAILVGEERIGMLEVCYLEEKPPDYEGPFLKEERTPMDRIAELVSNRFACRGMETALHTSEQQYREFIALLLVGIAIGDLDENAVIHNKKRPRRVWVTLRKTKGGFEISIADNESGISDEKKESLFVPERRFGGVGIHQALRIAQKYDGHISIDDRAAKDSSQGAKFRLWLPKSDTSVS